MWVGRDMADRALFTLKIKYIQKMNIGTLKSIIGRFQGALTRCFKSIVHDFVVIFMSKSPFLGKMSNFAKIGDFSVFSVVLNLSESDFWCRQGINSF